MNALCDSARQYAPVVGRIMIAIVFLSSAYGKLTGFEATAAAMAARGMGMTHVLLTAAIAIELVASVMLIVGWYTRWAALALVVFLTTATLYFHNYWTYPPEQQRNQRNHFMKNVGFVGGLIFIIGMGAGPRSIDSRRSARRRAPS
jgi:putative oxidoreductase